MSVGSTSSITVIYRLLQCASHLSERLQNQKLTTNSIWHTVDTTPAWHKQAGLAQDSQWYMVQAHKLFNSSVHHHSKQLQVSSCKAVEAGGFDWVNHERGCTKTSGTHHYLCACNWLSIEYYLQWLYVKKVNDILFGMARNATSVNALRWARRTLLWTRPFER